MKKSKKVLLIMASIAFVALVVFAYFRFYYVFGVGVKTGELNYVVNKGYIFKTYEGKIIQSGFQTENKSGIHSNEFIFSIEDEELAKKLMTEYEGKEISLQYEEYLGALPWRGYSKYVVNGIVSVSEKKPENQTTIPPVYQ